MFNRLLAPLTVTLLFSATASFAEQSPTQAYMELHEKELAATSYNDILKVRSKSSIAQDPPMSDEEKVQIFPLFHETLPKVVNITGESIEGNKATIKATAPPETTLKPGDSETTTGTINMVLEDGEWKIEKESWNSSIEAH